MTIINKVIVLYSVFARIEVFTIQENRNHIATDTDTHFQHLPIRLHPITSNTIQPRIVFIRGRTIFVAIIITLVLAPEFLFRLPF